MKLRNLLFPILASGLIMTTGKNKVANLIGTATTASGATFGYLGIGTSNATSTDITLNALVAQTAEGRLPYATQTVTTDTLTTVATFTFPSATRIIYEIGLFSAASSGTMLSRTVLTSSITCTTPNDTLQVTSTVQVNQG
jgi:hypothetical protein